MWIAHCSRHLFLSDRDKKGRVHIMEILLDKAYPKCPPSVSADVPYIFKLEWSMNSRLKDVVQQFQEHVEKLQDFWSTLDDIDRSLWVVDPKQPHRATSFRQINTGDDCSIILLINANDPRSIPEMKGKLLPENLASVLDTQLPGPPDAHKNGQHRECGICYAQYLPIDDELGAKSGSGTDYTCDNNTCSRAFHSVCLGDWLRSITTTRQYVDFFISLCNTFIHLEYHLSCLLCHSMCYLGTVPTVRSLLQSKSVPRSKVLFSRIFLWKIITSFLYESDLKARYGKLFLDGEV
ncbi:hypothetical protein RJ639_039198, partial [Escallonia herrerae]